MSSTKKQLIFFMGQTAIGLVALYFAIFVPMPDDYRSGVIYGIVGGFLTTGVLGLIASYRLMKNPTKEKAVETAKNEERTIFIRDKANSVTYLFMIYLLSAGTLIAGLMGWRIVSVTLAIILIIQGICKISALTFFAKKY